MRPGQFRGVLLVFGFLLAAGAAPQLSAQSNPVPFVNQPLVPGTAAPGGPAFTLTVNGTGFVSGSVVNWNGSPRTTTFVSSSQLTAAVLASDVAQVSVASVTVVNPAPGGGTSNPVFYQVAGSALPVLLSSTSLPLPHNPTSTAPDTPVAIVAADLNGDGILDLVVADTAGVTVLLGSASGTFASPVTYATGLFPEDVAVGDFNGDGKLDLAVVNLGDNTVSVLLGNGDGTFQPQVTYPTGAAPQYLAVGDFKGDGKLDLAVANSQGSSVSILLGNGDGTFQTHMEYATGSNPVSVSIGDFNGDGKLDLALANYFGNTVSILLGNGDGTFQPHVDYAVGIQPSSTVAGDFNGDGKLDLAVANTGSGTSGHTVSVLLGNGDGTFQSAVNYATGAGSYGLALGDLNGDGILDLAVVNNFDNTVSVLLGNGNGTFQPQLTYGGVAGPLSLALGEFSNDGRLDIAVANGDANSVSVFNEQTGSAQADLMLSPSSLSFPAVVPGASSAAQAVTLSNSGQIPASVGSISVSGTDPSDFSQTNNCPSSLASGANCTINVTFSPTQTGQRTALLTVSAGASTSPSANLTGYGAAPTPTAIVSPASLTFGSQPLGAPSPPQIVTVTNVGTAALTVSSIMATGDFQETDNCVATSPIAPNAACTVNVTFTPTAPGARTGTLMVSDNAAGSPQTVGLTGIEKTGVSPVPLLNQPLIPGTVAPGGPVYALTVNGTGFVSGSMVNWNGSPRTTTFVSSFQLTAAIQAADIAQIGVAAVTVVSPAPGGGASNPVYYQVAGSALPVMYTSAGSPIPSSATSVVAADLNGDGILDLVLSASSGACVLLGNGNGTFQTPVCYPAGSNPQDVTVGDFNGDGKLDLAVANLNDSTVSVLLGNGDGTFQPQVTYRTGLAPQYLAAADFVGDGQLDLAVANSQDSTVSILLGNGDGTFQPHVDYATGDNPVSVSIGDFNGDGVLDLALANYFGNTVSILLGNGDGTFQSHVDYPVGLSPSSTVVGDFNGDGKLDLAVANIGDSTASVLLGNGDGTFQAAVSYATGAGSFRLAMGDLNGDGILDLAVVNNFDNTLSVLLGNGDGTFQPQLGYGGMQGPVSLALGELSGDGRLDAAVLNESGNVITIFTELVSPPINVAPASMEFAGLPIGVTSPPQTITVTNTGSAPLNLAGVSFTADGFPFQGLNDTGDFAQTNNCTSAIAPKGTCQIQVTFTPTAAGTRGASVRIANSPMPNSQILGQGQDFSVGPAPQTPTSVTVTPGQQASYSLAIAAVNGFTQTVSLACTGAPSESTCMVPTTVNVNGATATVMVNVTTTAPSQSGHLLPELPPTIRRYGPILALIALLAMMLLARQSGSHRSGRRQLAYGAAVLLIFSTAWLASACHGNSTPRTVAIPVAGTPAGSYMLNVTATFTPAAGMGTATSHSTQFTLIVQSPAP